MFEAQAHVQDTLKSLDPERYLCSLYLPEKIRHLAMTLYAFDVEIARIPYLVSEPMPGEIRIQWWRDLIKSGGNAGSGPLAQALLEVITDNNLPRDVFDNSLEARIFDLYQDAMPDLVSYEGYLGETVSSLLHMIALASGSERNSDLADACGHAGVAIGMTKHLSLCAQSRIRGQVYIPLSILQNHGLDRETWLSSDLTNSHEAVISEMVDLAKSHLAKAKLAIAKLPKNSRIVFLQVLFVEPVLRNIAKNTANSMRKPVVLSPLRRQWLAFRGSSTL